MNESFEARAAHCFMDETESNKLIAHLHVKFRAGMIETYACAELDKQVVRVYVSFVLNCSNLYLLLSWIICRIIRIYLDWLSYEWDLIDRCFPKLSQLRASGVTSIISFALSLTRILPVFIIIIFGSILFTRVGLNRHYIRQLVYCRTFSVSPINVTVAVNMLSIKWHKWPNIVCTGRSSVD